MRGLRYLFVIAALILTATAAWYVGYNAQWGKTVKEENVTVIIEKIKRVFKLVSVEANISEIYNYQDYNTFNIDLFRKKALLRVNAKVSAGYDFEKVEFVTDQATKTLIIKNLPPPEVFYVDHDIDYYDVQQGTFNAFTEEDYNRLNAKAKAFIEAKAHSSDILKEAAAQKDEILELMRLLLETNGWTLTVEQEEPLN